MTELSKEIKNVYIDGTPKEIIRFPLDIANEEILKKSWAYKNAEASISI